MPAASVPGSATEPRGDEWVQYQSDYILRLIEQMGGLIRRALERLRLGEHAESYELTRQAISLALDMDPELVSRLSPASLRSLIEMANLDDRVVTLVADAFELEALVLERSGDMMEAETMRQQAAIVRGMLDPGRAN